MSIPTDVLVTNKRALVVDDSRTMRMIIGRSLRALGFAVTEAANGREALDVMARSGPFEVAFVDWNMPVMDGLQFVETAHADPAAQQMRILMVTTETEQEQVVKALAAGAHEYLMKPFSPEAVAEKLLMMGLGGDEAS